MCGSQVKTQDSKLSYVFVAPINYDAFIYDTQQLSVIRGGSELARMLPTEVQRRANSSKDCPNLTPVSVGGSQGLFSVDGDESVAASAAKWIKSNLTEDNQYQYIPIVISYHNHEDFNMCLASLHAKANWQQMQNHTARLESSCLDSKQDVDNMPGNPVCDITQLRSAHHSEAASGWTISDFANNRLSHGRNLASEGELFRKLTGMSLDNISIVQSFEDIARIHIASDEPATYGKLAFVYFDGNRFGNIRKTHEKSAKSLCKFDKYLTVCRTKLLKKILKDSIKARPGDQLSGLIETDKQGKQMLKMSPLLWGGDESMLVVPACCGIGLTHYINEKTSNWKTGGEQLTHSFGLLISHYKTPVSEAQSMATALAEMGKNKTRSKSTWTFAIMRSLDYVPFSSKESAFDRYFRVRFGNQESFTSYLFGLSFGGSDAAKQQLTEALRVLVQLPRGQVRRIADRTCQGDWKSALEFEERLLEKLITDDPASIRAALQAIAGSWLRATSKPAPDKPEPDLDRLLAWVLLEELYEFLPSLSALQVK